MSRWASIDRALGAAVLTVTAVTATSALAQTRIEAVSASVQNGAEIVRIDLDQAPTAIPQGFLVQSPARIALDFPGLSNATGASNLAISQGNVQSASVVEAAGRTRVVLNLKQATTYSAQVRGSSVFVALEPVAARSVLRPTQSVFAESHNDRAMPLRDVDFRRGTDNAGRVVVDLVNDQVGVDIQRQGNKLVVQFLETSLPEGLRRRLDVTDFGTPVQTISATQSGDSVRMEIESVGEWEHSAYQSNQQLVVEVRQLKTDPNRLTAGSGPGFHGERLSLNFQNIDVRSLLQVIADFTDFNIVTSDTVQGNLTLRLKDVPWDQALHIILEARHLGMRREGNVLRIAPKDELAAKEKAELEALADIEDLQPLLTESFQLNYTRAEEIQGQLTSSGSGGSSSDRGALLSSRGSVVIDRRTNQIFISDIPSRLERIREMISKLDIPIRQVLIEARIVEAADTFGKSLGVKLGGVDTRGSRRVEFGGNYNALSGGVGSTRPAQFVNLPAAAMGGATPATFAISLFSSAANRFLNLELSALEADGRGRVISSPRVVTADQTTAVIKQGQERAYQEATSSGATAVSFKEAVLKLEVTPQITPEGDIILDLEVNKDSFGVDSFGGEPPINTNQIKTNVLVENGGTVVIGGIFKLDESEQENKVPLLGDIPVVGNLFKQRSRQMGKEEIIVFITPKVISDHGAIR